MFHSAVGGHEGHTIQPAYRCNIHYGSAPSPKHGGDLVLHAKDYAEQHNLKIHTPFRSGLIDDRRGRPGEACAIDGTIEAAKFPDGQIDHRLDGLFIGNVGRDEFRDATACFDGGHHIPAPGLVPVCEDDLCTLLRKEMGARLTHAGGGASYDNYLVSQIHR
jgi:hypothetical protein